MGESGVSGRLAALQARRQASESADVLTPPSAYRGAPDVAWWRNPTMWLAVVTAALYAAGWWSYLGPGLTAWVVVPVLAIATYLAFTVFHESVHRTAHANRRINDALGWPGSIALGFVYPVFRISHLKHHAHTNDPDNDPDHHVAGEPKLLFAWWLIGTLFNYRVLVRRHRWGSTRDRAAQIALDAVIIGVAVTALATGHAFDFWVLYVGPLLVAGLWLLYFFDYLPHRPHTSRERFHDTRIQPGRVRHAVLLAQNYHLIHHLWVSVPWYRYRQVFRSLEPDLRAKQVRID